jgi:hypothetical protein
MIRLALEDLRHAFAAGASATQTRRFDAGFLDCLEQGLVFSHADFEAGALEDCREWNAADMAATE